MERNPDFSPTPYPDLNAVLAELVCSVQEILGGSFVSACLQGSFATGGFDDHSDVDFVIVIEDELSEAQVQALQVMHERIYALSSPWAQHLEGSYFPKETLRSYTRSGTDLVYLDNGSKTLDHDYHDNSLVVRSVMRSCGIRLAGADPASLIDPIPTAALRREMLNNSLEWWKRIQAKPPSIGSHFYQTFAVLHFCRILHDLYNGYPGSKPAAAEWVKARYPAWSGLIGCTWLGRPVPEESVRRPADPADLQLTLEFIPFIMQEAEEFAARLDLGPNQDEMI